MRHSRSLRTLAGLGDAALVLSACSAIPTGSSSSRTMRPPSPLLPAPRLTKILKYIQDNLAKDAGIPASNIKGVLD